jgi:cyclopropane fatty-acyl-phospholipid synthase-like methyltransferase
MDWENLAATARTYARMYDRFLPGDKDARILDLGCGSGHFLHFLLSRGYRNPVGVEQDVELASFVRASITPSVISADMFTFLESEKAANWKTVSLNDVVEHLNKSDAIRLLKLVGRILTEDGQVFIKTNNMSSPVGARGRYMDFTHEQGFTEESLLQLVRAADLESVYIGPESETINRFQRLALFPVYKFFGGYLPRVVTPYIFCVAQNSMRSGVENLLDERGQRPDTSIR